MRRALELARRGEGWTRPNPMVGAVVVRGRRVVGEGWHRRPGADQERLRQVRTGNLEASPGEGQAVAARTAGEVRDRSAKRRADVASQLADPAQLLASERVVLEERRLDLVCHLA